MRPRPEPRSTPPAPPIGEGTAAPWAALALAAAMAFAGAAPASGASPASKLDPRLVAAARPGVVEPVSVWVTFTDKGERSPAELAAALAEAASALSPRNRARRERARVSPLVDYRDLPVDAAYLAALAGRGLAPVAVSRWLNRAAVRVPGERLLELAATPFVDRIAPVERVLVSAGARAGAERRPAAGRAPSGAGAPRPGVESGRIDYGRTLEPLLQLRLPAVHDSGYTGRGVLVCILDAGFNRHDRHEALADGVIAPGHRRDFVDGDTTVTDTTRGGLEHGTWVMGCIAGRRPGAYVGAAFDAEFALARTEEEIGESPVEMLYWGMGAEWADSLGADIISSSLGYFTFDGGVGDYAYRDMDGQTTDVSRAALIAARKGILVVNAVGNEGDRPWRYLIAPADVHGDSLIAVGAVDASGSVASFSSWGPSADDRIKPDLAARGVAIPVVSAAGDPRGYELTSGTSFATPLVAGLAACLAQARPSWSPQDIIRAMRATASHAASPDNRVGYGIPDGLAALRGERDPRLPPTPRGLALALVGPNPIRADGPAARLRFALADRSLPSVEARLRVVDASGRAIRQLWSGTLCLDRPLAADWDGRDGTGRRARPGVYWITLTGGGLTAAVRLVSLG